MNHSEKLRYEISSSYMAQEEFFLAMPKEIFKYRCWRNEYHKSILTKHELFLSSPGNFNDPYDCGLPFNQDPNDWEVERIKLKVEKTAPAMFPEYANDPKRLEELCAKQVMLIQQDPKEWFKIHYGYKAEDLSQMFGVISLALCPDNFLMWSHYSDSHAGFCVGFDTRKLVKHNFGKFAAVNYADEIPLISILDDRFDLMDKLIYTKSKIWGYESEYRISSILKSNSTVQFSSDTINSIYLGNKMNHSNKMEIIDIVKSLKGDVKVYDMNLGTETFRLEPMRVF